MPHLITYNGSLYRTKLVGTGCNVITQRNWVDISCIQLNWTYTDNPYFAKLIIGSRPQAVYIYVQCQCQGCKITNLLRVADHLLVLNRFSQTMKSFRVDILEGMGIWFLFIIYLIKALFYYTWIKNRFRPNSGGGGGGGGGRREAKPSPDLNPSSLSDLHSLRD